MPIFWIAVCNSSCASALGCVLGIVLTLYCTFVQEVMISVLIYRRDDQKVCTWWVGKRCHVASAYSTKLVWFYLRLFLKYKNSVKTRPVNFSIFCVRLQQRKEPRCTKWVYVCITYGHTQFTPQIANVNQLLSDQIVSHNCYSYYPIS